MSSSGRASGFRECARRARDLIQPVVDALDNGSSTPRDRDEQELLASANEALASAVAKLFSVDKSLELSDGAIRQELTRAYDAMEMAAAALSETVTSDAVIEDCRHRVAQALALIFASGGGEKAMPSLRQSSTSFRAVRASSLPPSSRSPTGPPSSAYPLIEVDELGPESFAGLAPEIAAWLENPTTDVVQGEAGMTEPSRAQSGPPSERRSQWAILEIEVGFVGEHNFFAGLTMDVSEGGLFVATYQSRPVGTRLMLSFVLPDGQAITTPGVVKFVIEAHGDVPPGMGVAFLELKPPELKAIRAFCKSREPTYYDVE